MKNSYKVIGVMSGTSLDGLDIAYCIFRKKGKGWEYSIEAAETYNYSGKQKAHLNQLMRTTGEELIRADIDFGKMTGEKIKLFIRKNKIGKVDLIASHGHTIFHQPEKGFTFQIGNGAAIHAGTELPVICDFRSVDVLYGGQGAPLVPIGDKLLFREYDYCLNLGGISNISFDYKGRRIAYDISPVNIVLNKLAGEFKLPFDKGGKLGSRGKSDETLLTQLNSLPYYAKKFPRSIGREWIDNEVFPLLEKSGLSIEDTLATFYVHTSYQIANEIKKYRVQKKKGIPTVLCTGGGALNTFLIRNISEQLKGIAEAEVPGKNIILFKEALIFAFLGVLRSRNEVNCLSSVTGALKDNIGGAMYGA